MISSTWANKGLPLNLTWPGSDRGCRQRVSASGPTCPYTASSQLSDDGKTVFVRFTASAGANVTLALNGKFVASSSHGSVKQTTINAANISASNTPADPDRVQPRQIDIAGSIRSFKVPSNSFTVFEIAI